MSVEPRRMTEEKLGALARGGDKSALAELRRRGCFLRLKEEGRRAPLSRAQRRLWLLEQLGADNDAYNLPAVYRIDGDMDSTALAEAFRWLSARHGQLRAHFMEEDGEPRQAVVPAASFVPPFMVRGAIDFDAALTAVRRFAAEGFSLSHAPLWRAGWWRLAEGGGVFAWVFHHAIADEWSLNILSAELGAAYAAFAAGKEPDLPAPGFSYFDWTDREAEYVVGSKGEADRDWWLSSWLPPPPPLELPTDYPRPAERSFAGAVAESDWDDELAENLSALARRERVTPFACAMTLMRVFLFRLTGQDDTVIGFPHANRGSAGADAISGFMANTLALRRRVDGTVSFAEQLLREGEFLREALARGGYPFDSLVEHAARPRDMSRSPIFDVMATMRGIGNAGEGFSPIRSGYAKARFDAVFEWRERGGGLAGLDITYATSLFSPERAQDWLRAMEVMARAVAADPELPVESLPLLDDAGRKVAVAEAGGSVVPLPWAAEGKAPLGWLFEGVCAAHPDRPAVEDVDCVWTYRELDAASRRVAGALRRAGIRAGDRVASVLPRSRRLAAALWGIWRVGGVYVPVEPSWPEARRRFVIEDSGAKILLTGETPVDDTDDNDGGVAAWAADGLAYIIYTSGSTGTPKGVAVPPKGVVNMALAQAAAFGVAPDDRALALASTAFDASLAEMLVGWAKGACVVMAPDGIAADAQTLAEWLPRTRPTLMTVTPALLSLLPRAAFAGVKTLLTAGEAARGGDLLPLVRGGVRVFNAYGPTECSVCATLREVTAEDCADPFGVPVGLPIANVSAFVLDASGQPCLPDTPGDLWLGGTGLAQGYWNRPGLTRETFRGNMYRTGDRARRRRDGTLVFLGRLDDQVKIRGNRVEVQEVARALADALPERATAVLPRKTGGETELVALIAAGDGNADGGAIDAARRLLAEKLPSAMRPGRYLAVESLPRDGNGKVDRRALSGLLARLDEEATAGREPSLPRERELLTAWREALGHGRLSVSDDFFLAGGHSLSSLRAAALSAEKTGLVVTARDILSHPTVEGLAAALSARMPAEAKEAERTARRSDGGGAAGVSFEPLDGRVVRGDLPPLDAAALGYFPDSAPDGIPAALWTRERVVDDWCGGGARLLHVYDTCFGRTGLVALPLFHTDLFGNAGRLMERVGEGLAVAKSCGARVVSLTGLLPSVTAGGKAIAERFPAPEWPLVTHGHASTAAALLKGAERLLRGAGREWRGATAGFLGLGSVGALTARLWMRTFPAPKRILLADVPSKRQALDALAAEWKEGSPELDVEIIESPSTPPDAWYAADLMLCAVGTGEIVDVSRLRPGTLLADDSAPPCFSHAKAAERMRRTGDVLTIESGDLSLPEAWRRITFRPEGLRGISGDGDAPRPADALRMTSCVLSGLLLAKGLADCPQCMGDVSGEQARAHWLGLEALGVGAPEFRCGAADSVALQSGSMITC